MSSTVRHVGFHNPAVAFPLLERRSLAVNTANLQLAVGNEQTGASTGVALPLLAIRFFSIGAQYVTGDWVVQGGQLWKAITTVTPGAFNPAQWVGMSDGGQYLLRDGTREMFGNLEIEKPGASLVLNAVGPSQSDIWFRQDDLTRWLIRSRETSDGDLVIARFDDGGFVVDMPLTISRSTGRLSVLTDPVQPLELTTKRYVDARVSTVVVDTSTLVQKAGDTMTGGLTVPVLTIRNPSYSDLYYAAGGPARWLARGADGTTSNYELHRYDAAGTYLGAAMVLVNASGDALFQRNVSAGGYFTATPGLQFGGSAPSGFYGDGGNIAIRTYGNNTIYFQSQNGTLTYATLNTGGLAVTAGVSGTYLTASASDGLRVLVPAGSNARTLYDVSGVRQWTAGVYSDGRYAIGDESAGAARFIINLDGSIDIANNLRVPGTLTAGALSVSSFSVTGPMELSSLEGIYYIDFRHPGDAWDNSARIITGGNSPSPGGKSPLNIECGELAVNASVRMNGFFGKQGTDGPHQLQRFNLWNISYASVNMYIENVDVGPIHLTWWGRSSRFRNIEPIPSMWDAVKKLQPVKYTTTQPLSGEDIERWGFTAENLREAAHKSAVIDDDAVEPWPVIAALTKALQEAMQRIEALEARLA